jgi:hypothetical protein
MSELGDSPERRAKHPPLDCVDEGTMLPFELSSPRSLQALRHCHLRIEQLHFKPLESFKAKDVPTQVAKISFEASERKRRERLAQAKKEYRAICR